jgi:hypothetical protein
MNLFFYLCFIVIVSYIQLYTSLPLFLYFSVTYRTRSLLFM